MTRGALRLVLASASPRRRDLISVLDSDVMPLAPEIDETPLPDEVPAAHALRVALAKARAGAALKPDHPVLAADTIVVLDGEILGKPRSRDDARSTLGRLSGRTHDVMTGLAVSWRGREATHLETTRVTFAALAPDVMDWYVATGECDDKAGSYAIQARGALLVERIEGNVQSVMGLPLAALPALFARVGLALHVTGSKLVLIEI